MEYLSQYHFISNNCPNDYGTLFESLIYFYPTDGLSRNPDFIGGQNAQPHILEQLISICCGKQKPNMSPLRKQGSRTKKLDSRFRGNDKSCFRNRNQLVLIYSCNDFNVFNLEVFTWPQFVNYWLLTIDNQIHRLQHLSYQVRNTRY